MMSPRCYELAEKVMDLYEAGELEKKRQHSHTYIAVHATYFDFMYNYNVLEQEDEVYEMLKQICTEKKRPARRQSKKEEKERKTLEEEYKALEHDIAELRKTLSEKETTLASTKAELEETKKTKSEKEAILASTESQLEKAKLTLTEKEIMLKCANAELVRTKQSLSEKETVLANTRAELKKIKQENKRMRKNLVERGSFGDSSTLNENSVDTNSDSNIATSHGHTIDDMSETIGILRSGRKRKFFHHEQTRQKAKKARNEDMTHIPQKNKENETNMSSDNVTTSMGNQEEDVLTDVVDVQQSFARTYFYFA